MNLLEALNSLAFRNLLFITISISLIMIFSSLLIARNKFLKNYSKLFLTCTLFLFSLLKLFFHDLSSSAFIWPNTLDFSLSYAIISPEPYNQDIGIIGLLNSPKYIFAKILTTFNSYNISPLHFAEIIDLFKYFYPIIYFLIGTNILELWFKKKNGRNIYLSYLFMFLFILYEMGIFPIFSLFFSNVGGHLTYLIFNTAVPSDVSFFFGFLFLLSYSNSKNYNVLSFFMFLISSILNPITTLLNILSLWFIFFFLKTKNYNHLFILISIVIISGLCIKLSFFSQTNLSAETFIKIYITERHPHHYLISHYLTYKTFLMPISFLLPYFFINESKLKLIPLFCFLFYIGSLIITYLFIELIPIKIIGIITPNRFTRIGIQLLFFEYSLFCNYLLLKNNNYKWFISLFANKNILKKILHFSSDQNYAPKFKRILILFYCGIFFIILSTIPNYRLNNINNKMSTDADKVVSWLKQNTQIDDVLLIHPNDYNFNSYIRIFSSRSIYVDHFFPFNEDYFLEWYNRNNLIKDIFNNKSTNIEKLINHVDYLIIKADKDNFIKNLKPLASFQDYKIYFLNDLK